MTFLNRHRSRIRPVGPFAPSSLFFGGIPGAWYDPTDLSTMFQDSTGTTPVTAVEQPVGLILDKSQGVTEGTNLRSVGAVALIGVAPVATYNTTTGAATASRVDAANQSGIQFTVTANTLYRLTVTVASGNLSMQNGTLGASALAVIGPGTTTIYLQPTTTTLTLAAQANGMTTSFTVTSLQSIAGNHASQSTAASRPTYRARYNALTQSEDFSQAVWTKTSSTVSANTSVAPDGTTTADTLSEAAAVSFHGANHQSVSVPVGTTLTLSASFKKGTSRYAQLNFGGSGAVSRWVSCVIDLDTGSITQSSAGAQATLVSAVSSAQGNGWYRVSLTGSVQTDTSIFSYVNMVSTGTPTLGSYGVETYLGVITNNILIWGAQLLTAADVTATGNAYQRIAAATVYDTAPIFRPYLAFDGVDDSLATAAINFTSTDKMTVFAGATKSSDAARGMLAELSVGGGAGSFNISAPAGASATYSCSNGGTVFVGPLLTAATFAAPVTDVLTFTGNISAPSITLSVDRVSAINDASAQGVGTYGTYPLFIGRRNNASLPFNGRLFSLIVRGAASSVTEIADTELWVNARTGGF